MANRTKFPHCIYRKGRGRVYLTEAQYVYRQQIQDKAALVEIEAHNLTLLLTDGNQDAALKAGAAAYSKVMASVDWWAYDDAAQPDR